MAKGTLLTNFVDDILNATMNGKRRYNLIPNDDGTYSLEDVTTYDQIGTELGAAILNAIANAVNESADKNKIIDDIDTINGLTEEGYIAGGLALKNVTNSLTVKEFHVNWTTYWGVNGFALSNANIKILNVQITVPITGDIPAHVETLVGQITSDFAIPASNIMTTFGTYSGNVGTLIIKPNGDIIIFSANIITQGDTLYVNMCW